LIFGTAIAKGWARNADAFEAVYRENASRLRAFLRQIVGSSEVAEDLTQEIFAHLWSQPDGFDPTRGTIRAYLFGIGRHRAAEWWRQSKPQVPLEDDRCATSDPEQESLIADALQRLPEDQRMLLWLREIEGQSYAELAIILDVPVGTVRSRLFMARQGLRKIWLGVAEGDLHEMR
jgi:RNA polymerase sigma-70 factor (ECF subfamily)